MTDSEIKCMDSSAWLAYYLAPTNPIIKLVDEPTLLITSSLSLYEIKKRLTILKKNHEEFLQFIKERSLIIAPGIKIAENAAEISIKHKLAAMDSIIYATAMISDAELITGDNDFKNLEKVRIIQ